MKRFGFRLTSIGVVGLLFALTAELHAGPILLGFDSSTLPANDDGSTGLVPLGFTVNFFGTSYTSLYVNNNGNMTFDSALSTYTPFNLLTTGRVIIAPFFADVDTRTGNVVTYGTDTVGSRPAFGVNWPDVLHYSISPPTNRFQVLLIDRSDVGAGDFDIEFNYEQILWEAGTASGSNTAGLGGSSARVGWSDGVANFFELPGSAINGALIDGGPNALISNSLNSGGVLGRYIFNVRNGEVIPPPPVPEPSTLALLGIGTVGLLGYSRRRKRKTTS